MSTCLAVVFHDESTASEMRAAFLEMQNQYLLLEVKNAVALIRDLNGKVKVDTAVSLNLAGETIDVFWGALEETPPGSSALIVLFQNNIRADKMLDGLKQFAGKGKVFQTSLSKDEEKSLREVLETPPISKAACERSTVCHGPRRI